ncbi:MAG: hypothetical protein ABI378_03510 [Chitinophagaceae bacterium]
MTQSDETKVMEALYDRLFQAVTYAPAGQESQFNQKTTFVQFAKNQPLNASDFANPLSPVNPGGNLNSSELFARMVDIQPALSSDYAPTANLVSGTYLQIVNGANTKLTNDAAQLKLYNQAYSYLNTTIKIKDFTGVETTSIQPSAIYNTYSNNRTAYVAALCAYRTAYLGYDLTKIPDQRQWQANEPMLANAVSSTYNTWRSQGATQVEQAIAALASSINNIVAKTISDAQSDMVTSKMASSMGIAAPWYMTYATPTNWYDPSAVNNFSSLTLKSDNLTTSGNTSYTDYSSGGSASWGLWSVSAEVGGHHQESHEHMNADTFQLSAKIAVVQINRPWLNDLLFKLQGWWLTGQKVGGISNGQLANNSKGLLPLIPTAFIIARDISITANWTDSDKSHVEDSIATKASVGWGPFSVNGSYSHGSSSDYFHSSFNGGTLAIPGMQVIGWVNEIVPSSASLAV